MSRCLDVDSVGPCSYSGCQNSAMFNGDYCEQHSNQKSTVGSDMKNQMIRFEIDGKKKSIDSKELETLLNDLEGAKKFWIVDLTIDEKEFVQYAIEQGELEHWDKLEMIESKEMTPEEAFSTLRTKITGDYSGHELWWSEGGKPLSDESTEGHAEEELDQQEKAHPILFSAGIFVAAIFLIGMFIADPGMFLGEMFFQAICGLIFLAGGAGASTLGRSDTGKFT